MLERGKLVFGQPWTRLDVMCSNTKTTTTTTTTTQTKNYTYIYIGVLSVLLFFL
jgi:hypothetical protein